MKELLLAAGGVALALIERFLNKPTPSRAVTDDAAKRAQEEWQRDRRKYTN